MTEPFNAALQGPVIGYFGLIAAWTDTELLDNWVIESVRFRT